MNSLLLKIIAGLGDKFYNYFIYYYLHLKNRLIPFITAPPLSMKNPKTFNDKIVYLKMNIRYKDAYRYADKILVRDYIAKKIGKEHLIPLLGKWSSSQEIPYDTLPNQFVLKTNHASGTNIIVKDKNCLDIDVTNKTLNDWLSINYFDRGREYQYRDIEPRILAEEMLIPEDGKDLKDFKIFCFSGVPRIIQVDVNRHTNHTRNFYDIEWNRLKFTILYPEYHGTVEKPEKLNEMLFIAKTLSHKFIFSRIDLYVVQQKIYFGEITFHHEGGFGPILPKEFAYTLGRYINVRENV